MNIYWDIISTVLALMTLLDMVRADPSLSEANNHHPLTTTSHHILEKNYIFCHREKASLSKKSELDNKCLHRDKYLLERC